MVGPPTVEFFILARHPSKSVRPLPVADRVAATLERFLHVEAIGGLVLLIATAAALVWANSPIGATYHALWHTPVSFGIGERSLSYSLEFLINDGLMTIFFLVVGLEIRREMHEGTLSTLRTASLPLFAALGGVVVPAAIYLIANWQPPLRSGWAIPTATDIAFAVGVLALLGRSVPSAIRVLLLALAVIDDIAAIIVIALFYSTDLVWPGVALSFTGIVLIVILQRLGVRSAIYFIPPGVLVWAGLLTFGVHPTLAGVILGLMTPSKAMIRDLQPVDAAAQALRAFDHQAQSKDDVHALISPLRQLKDAQRELLPPATRLQMLLHPWVAYGVMPLFALANAGLGLQGVALSDSEQLNVVLAVLIALLLGKPLGIFAASWLAVRAGWCSLPTSATWRGILVVGCLGGIGFTMAIFIANLAFPQPELLGAAKLGVLLASAAAAVLGLALGFLVFRTARPIGGSSNQHAPLNAPASEQEG